MAEQQRVAKSTRKVLVTLLDGRQLLGEVFLALYDAHHTGQQRLGELLNGEDDFIPFKTDEAVLLLNTAQIFMVKTGLRAERDELMTLGKKYPVEISTPHRRTLRGEVYVNLPDESSRVRDWLNQPLDFLRLFLPEHIVYLNRRHIVSVQDSPPAP